MVTKTIRDFQPGEAHEVLANGTYRGKKLLRRSGWLKEQADLAAAAIARRDPNTGLPTDPADRAALMPRHKTLSPDAAQAALFDKPHQGKEPPKLSDPRAAHLDHLKALEIEACKAALEAEALKRIINTDSPEVGSW